MSSKSVMESVKSILKAWKSRFLCRYKGHEEYIHYWIIDTSLNTRGGVFCKRKKCNHYRKPTTAEFYKHRLGDRTEYKKDL